MSQVSSVRPLLLVLYSDFYHKSNISRKKIPFYLSKRDFFTNFAHKTEYFNTDRTIHVTRIDYQTAR